MKAKREPDGQMQRKTHSRYMKPKGEPDEKKKEI